MLTFKENRIQVVRNLLDPVALHAVQLLIRQTIAELVKNPPDYFKPDTQLPLRYPLGRNFVTEAIMYAAAPVVSEIVGTKVLPTYCFPVINFPGAELVRHTDRPACEVTATLTLVNEPDTIWPIFLEERPGTIHRVDLNPGDMVLYDGIQYPHWRAPQPPHHFNVSVFYHFVVANGPFAGWHERELRQRKDMLDLYEPAPFAKLFPERDI